MILHFECANDFTLWMIIAFFVILWYNKITNSPQWRNLFKELIIIKLYRYCSILDYSNKDKTENQSSELKLKERFIEQLKESKTKYIKQKEELSGNHRKEE